MSNHTLNSDITEPAVILGMPGCMLEDVNEYGDHYFYRRSGKHLKEIVALGKKECLCKILLGPHAYLAQYCPLEIANDQLDKQGIADVQLYALRYRHRAFADREYELFLVHVKSMGSNKLGVRLLPFPEQMKLQISDLPGTDEATAISKVTTMPRGIRVAAPPIFAPKDFTLVQLRNNGLLPEVERAARFYYDVLSCLEKGHPPWQAWRYATQQHLDIQSDIPPSVAQVFDPNGSATTDDAINEVKTLWEHALDAPVLTMHVFPEILRCLRSDHDFGYAPANPLADRDRYFRLHIPLAELEEQDRCIGWLPMERDYRDERSTVRDELFTDTSQHFLY